MCFYVKHHIDIFTGIPDVRWEGASCQEVEPVDPDGWSILSRCQYQDMLHHAFLYDFRKTDTFNVYVPAGTHDFGGVSWLNNPYGLIMPISNLANNILPHEIGHAFNLEHTWAGFDGTNCERVTRDITNMNFNADVAGDYVVDTAAVPRFDIEYCWVNGLPYSDCAGRTGNEYYYLNTTTCQYVGSNGGCGGDDYIIFESDVRNFMGYTRCDSPRTFSIGQGVRIHETIEYDISNRFSNTQTTIAALYEPYIGSYPMYFPLMLSSDHVK